MTPDIFKALAETYGGELRRWPQACGGAAAALLKRVPHLEASLTAETELDAWLAADTPPAMSATLRRRMIGAALADARAGEGYRLSWLTRLGLAGACAAGLLVGVLAGPPAAGDQATLLNALAPFDPEDPVDSEAAP